MFAAGFFLISVHLVAYLTDKSYSPVLAASVMGLQGLLNVMGKFVGGVLCDRIGREKTLTFRAESINLFNTPQFAEPGTDLTSPSFGLITGVNAKSTLHRQFQAQLRFNF